MSHTRLATTSMTQEKDADNYINELTRLRHLLAKPEERIMSWKFIVIALQGLTEEYRGIKADGPRRTRPLTFRI